MSAAMKDFRQGLPPGSTVVLLAVVLGASLRFAGIGWGLQHPPHADEQAYVESVNAMLDAGDLDHRYYYYPGLFFYLLAPLLGLLGEARRHGPEAYLVCRVFVASVASLNVWLAGLVGRALGGAWAAAGASLALAVFPLSSAVAHEVRPDLCLETLGLLSVLLYSRERWEGREFSLVGLIAGLGTAIKFSGLLFLSGATASALVRHASFKRLLGAAVLAGAIVIAATPYALIHIDQYLGGRSELDVYFHGLSVGGFVRNVSNYTTAAFSFGGPIGALLVLAGLAALGKARRAVWLPWLVHFGLTLSVFSLASIAFPRHMLQVTGGLCVLFGLGLARLALASRAAASVGLVVALALPLRSTYDASRAQVLPSAPDRAKEWIDAHMKDGSVILESRRDAGFGGRAGASIGVDRSRFDFVIPEDVRRSEILLLMPHSDLVIVDADRSLTGSIFAGSTLAYEALGQRGRRVISLVVPANRFHPIEVAPARVLGFGSARTAALTDRRFATLWSSGGPMTGREWMEFGFSEPHRLCRVEIDMPLAGSDFEPEIVVRLARAGETEFHDVKSRNARPPREDQLRFGRPRGQAPVFDPEFAIAARLEQRGARRDPWTVSEVRWFSCPDQ
ncbi:MAG: hypothetical protein ABI565_03890 [Vicinamibacteria bacterium]